MTMRIALVLVLVACGSSKRAPPADKSAEQPTATEHAGTDVRVDRRVELISIVERLAGGDEYRKSTPNPYVAEVDAAFAPFAEQEAVVATRALRAKAGISFDAPMELAVHLDEQLQPRALAELATIDKRWAGIDVAAYAAQLREFAAASKFAAFFDAHQAYYAAVADKLRAVVDAEHPVEWLDKLFGPHHDARFTVVPGLLTGRMNYGVRANLPDRLEMFQILGVMSKDGLPVTDTETVSLLVHEMAHSYVNPLFERHRTELAPSGAKLYALVAKQMLAQHYNDAQIMLDESAVRAATVLYFREKRGDEAGARAARNELRLGFVWTNELAEELRKLARDHQPMESHMPAIVAFFDRLAVQYKSGLPPMLFLGPVDAAILNEPILVAPADPELAAYVGKVHDEILKQAPVVTASDHALADAPGRNLVAYGSPATNPIIANVLGWSQWKLAEGSITLGKRSFTGPGLVLVACWFRHDEPTRGVVVYAAARDHDLVGINHGLTHGANDWLVARHTAKGFEVLGTGDFPRAADGAWLLP